MTRVIGPDVTGVKVKGKRGGIITIIYAAEGEGPHPVIINLHGIPGCEQNGDLVHAFHDAGFDVATPHYSGCFGSDGDYRLKHNIEDAEAVLDFILSDEDYNFDKERIYALGHSMGGFTCANLSGRRKEIKKTALIMPCDAGSYLDFEKTAPEAFGVMRQVLLESCNLLNGVEYEDFEREIMENSESWKFTAHAKALSEKELLVVKGMVDTITPPEVHCEPLIKAVKEIDGSKLSVAELDTEHFFFNSRTEMIYLLKDFFLE